MFTSHLLRGAGAAAIAVALSNGAEAQQNLPNIDIGAHPHASAARSHSRANVTTRAQTGAAAAAEGAAGQGASDAQGPLTEKAREQRESTAYARTRAISATKTNAPILDTPRSVVIVPKQVLEDNQVLNVQEAVKFVSGVQTAAPFYDSYLIRGFPNGSNTYRNGLKLYSQTNTEDVAFIDRVEILKGPAAMLYGRIQPGGLVNFVTKRPQEEAAHSVQTQFGSWGLSRTVVDSTGPLLKDKTLLYRVIGVYDHADDYIDFRHRDNGQVYTALTYRPDNRFEANAQIEYYNQRTTNIGSNGQQIPAAAMTYQYPGIVGRPWALPRNWTQSEPGMYGALPSTMERVLAAVDWSYRINDKWKVTNRFHYNVSLEDQEYLVNAGYNAFTGDIRRNVSWTIFKPRQTWSTNLDVTGEVTTGPVKHNLLIGFDYYSYRSVNKGDNPSYTVNPTIATFNAFAPAYGGVALPQILAEHAIAQGNILFRTKQDDWGYYLQDDLNYEDKIHLLLGGRYDVAFDASAEIYGVTSSYYTATGLAGTCFPICDGHYNPPWKGNPTERKISPNAGLLFKITPEYSVFSSFSQSFANSNAMAQSYDGTPFKPEEAWQYEAGGKASWWDGRVTASLVAFELHRKNVLSADPLHTGYSVASGEVRSRGLEADLAGQATDNISLIASYTYDDAFIVADTATGTASKLGRRWPGVPRHAGNLWAKYDTAPGQKQGWTFGAGFYANGERQGNNTNSYQLPGYVRFDTMVGYRFLLRNVPVEAQLNVTNIGDAKYFEASSGQYSYYGAPRTFTGSLKVKF
jgi:iron complex outermembrane recepter protein